MEISGKAIATARSLSHPPVATSITADMCRKHVRWLRNLNVGEKTAEDWLAASPEQQPHKAQAVLEVIESYAALLAANASHRDALAVRDANDAVGALALGMADATLESLPEGDESGMALLGALNPVPPTWEMRAGQSLSRLLDIIATGIDHLVGDTTNKISQDQQFAEMNGRIQATAQKLRSIDMLAAPAREESVELAREILRRLKDLQFENKPVQQLIDSGKPEEKRAFANKLEELLATYHALLAEAAENDPALMKNDTITDANDTAGRFAYAISLMAAHDQGVAQPRSADVTIMPEHWKNLEGLTIGQMIKKIEDAIDKVESEIKTQQEKKATTQPQEQVQGKEQPSVQEKPRRPSTRRRGNRTAGTEAPRAPQPVGVPEISGLKPEDLAAVKALGSNLRSMNKKAEGSGNKKSETPATPKAIQDKGFSDRTKEDREKPRPPRRTDR